MLGTVSLQILSVSVVLKDSVWQVFVEYWWRSLSSSSRDVAGVEEEMVGL